MKNRNHGLSEKEMELVQLLMADCETTGDIQAKLKRLFAGTIEQARSKLLHYYFSSFTSLFIIRSTTCVSILPSKFSMYAFFSENEIFINSKE